MAIVGLVFGAVSMIAYVVLFFSWGTSGYLFLTAAGAAAAATAFGLLARGRPHARLATTLGIAGLVIGLVLYGWMSGLVGSGSATTI